MLTPLSNSSEADAVNNILATVGGETVTADHFDGTLSLSFTAQQAYNALRDSMRNLMGHAWDFNTRRDVELQADGFGQIMFDTTNIIEDDHRGPASFDSTGDSPRWVHGTGTTAGKDGMPGPLGYGHAYHWGDHATLPTPETTNIYLYYQCRTHSPETFADEAYFTASVYVKYHSSSQVSFLIWEQETDNNSETNVSIRLNFNTDGTIASVVTVVGGVEGGTDDAPADTTVPPLNAASYEDVGKGWYRLIVTWKVEDQHTTAQLKLQINPRLPQTEYGSTYLWGPQIVKHAYVTPYDQATGTKSLFIVNVDLDPVNAGDLDVVLRTNDYEQGSVVYGAPMLFDRKSNSFNAFSPNAKYKAVITYFMQYEDCPEAVKSLVVTMAAKEFQMQMVGNLYVDQILTQKYLQANQGFIEYETDQNELSIFNNYDVWKIMSYPNRPTAGVQAWYS